MNQNGVVNQDMDPNKAMQNAAMQNNRAATQMDQRPAPNMPPQPMYYGSPMVSKRGGVIKGIGITLLLLFSIAGIIGGAGYASLDSDYVPIGIALAIAGILEGLVFFGVLYGIGLVIDNTAVTNQKIDQLLNKK